MSQADLGNLDPQTTDGTELATLLTTWRTALHSSHKGPTRPTYAITGTFWIDDAAAPWTFKVFDGTEDVPLGTIDPVTHVFTPSTPVNTGLITGQLILSGKITPATITVDQANYNPPGLSGAVNLRLATDALRTVTGLAGGVDGRVVKLTNVHTFPIVLANESISSTDVNRFAFGRSITLWPGHSLTLWYDSGISRWRTMASTIFAGKQSLWVPAGAMIPRSTDGAFLSVGETAVNKRMRQSLDFDSAVPQFAQFEYAAPKSWDLGPVSYRVFYSHPATTVNFGTAWELQGIGLADGDSEDAAYGTAVVVTKTSTADGILYVTPESGPVTIAGTLLDGVLLNFQISRNPNNGADNLGVDARMRGAMLFFNTRASTDD